MKSQSIHFIALILFLNLAASPSVLGQHDPGYKVVVNHEEQYSIWLSGKDTPKGWKDAGFSGNLDKCQRYIHKVWTDMRPLSIQKLELPGSTRYGVVINHEEQYSIWPEKKAVPKGWKTVGKKGSLKNCMDYIEEVWTDMRPLSLRARLETP